MNIQNLSQFRKEEKKFDLTPRISLVSKNQRISSQNKNNQLNSAREIHNYRPVEPPRRASIQTETPYFPRNIQPIIPYPSQVNETNQPQFITNSNKQADNYYLYTFKKQRTNNGHTGENLQKNQFKNYEKQIQKLTRICEEFFRQNERLKQKFHTQQQFWKGKINEMLILKKSETAEQLYHKKQFINKSSENQIYNTNKFGLRKFAQTQYSYENLMSQLRKKDSELNKYMKKQQQYIQIYVQKEHLENQIRNLQKTIQNLNRKVEQYSKEHKNENLNPLSGKLSFPFFSKSGNKQIEKNVLEQNKKLLNLVTMSSKEVDRLNKILTNKILQAENNKAMIYNLNIELSKYKQKQEEQLNTHQFNEHKLMDQSTQYDFLAIPAANVDIEVSANTKLHSFQTDLQNMKQQNSHLQTQLQEQQNHSTNLNMQIQQLQKQLKIYMAEQDDRKTIKANNSYHIFKQYDEFYINNSKQIIETEEAAIAKIQAFEERIKCLKQQNNQLSSFIIQQNADIIKLKNHILGFTKKQQEMKNKLQKFAVSEKLLPKLITRVQDAELKLLAVTKQYQKILTEVQDSCNQSEQMHQKIEQSLENKNMHFTSKDFIIRPLSSRSQIGKNHDKTMKKNVQNSMCNLEDLIKKQDESFGEYQKKSQDLLESASQDN